MKIALFHNLPAGGAKRALFEHASGLRQRGHVLDAYMMDTANEDFLPLEPLCRRVYRYQETSVPASKLEARILFHPLMRPFWAVVGDKRRHDVAVYMAARRDLQRLDALENDYARMAQDIDARGYDIAYVHHCARLLSPYLIRCLRTPVVYYCQDTLRHIYEWPQPELQHPGFETGADTFLVRRRRGQLLTLPDRWVQHAYESRNADNARAATLVLANSWYSREAILRSYGVNARVCYLGVDSDFFCPDPAVVRENVVLSVGSFLPNKCHGFVIDSVARIPRTRRPRMRIIGYETTTGFGKKEMGPAAHALLRRARAQDVDLVLSQEVTDEVLRDGYRRAGVVAFAPHLEPFGLVALEAMACGTPVVGVNEGGVRETIQDGVTGFLTERDADEFGAALDRVLSGATLAADLGRNGRQRSVDHWNWSRSLDSLERLFGMAMQKRLECTLDRPPDGDGESLLCDDGALTAGRQEPDAVAT